MTAAAIPNQLWLITTLALITMVGPFTVDTYLPAFPSIEAYYHVNRMLMSQSIAIYLLAAGLSTLLWGALSDSIGRKTVIYGTVFLYILASIGCALSPNFSGFLFFRMLQGIAASGGMVVGRAIVRDAFASEQAHRVMAYIIMVFAIAPAIAPIIGGYLHDAFGWKSIFYFLTTYGFLLLLLTKFTLPETLQLHARKSFHPMAVLKVYCLTVKNKQFQKIIFTLGISFSGMFIYISGSPAVVFDILKLGSSDFSYLFVPLTSGIILGSYLSGKLSHYFNAKKIIWIAFAFMLFASVLNLVQLLQTEITVFSVITPLAIYAFGVALQMPAISILALDCFPNNRGSASAVQGLVQSIIGTLATAVIVPLLGSNLSYYISAQVSFLLLALVLWITVN